MRVIQPQTTEAAPTGSVAPAYTVYALRRTFRLAGFIITNMLVRTHTTRRNWLESMRDVRYFLFDRPWFLRYPGWLILPGIYITAWLQYLPAFLITLLFLVCYIPLSLLRLLLAFVAITLLSAYHALFIRITHVALYCPYCYAPLGRGPVYLCSGCQTEHPALYPDSHGIFAHRCTTCQTHLPTLDRLGRKRLARICPSCRHPLSPILGTGIPVHIPLIGGPATGKTSWLTGALTHLQRLSSAPVTFLDPLQQQTIATQWQHIIEGKEITPTEEITPPALVMSVKRSIPRHIYCYDPSGAALLVSERTQQQSYYAHSSGLVLLIDPATIPAFYRREQLTVVPPLQPPGHQSFPYIYERFLHVFEAFTRLSTRQRYPQPVAVVVTKVDRFHLEKRIGRPAARQLMAQDSGITTAAEATHKLVRAFLCDYELENVVRDLEAHFTHVRYFSSAYPANPAEMITQRERETQQAAFAEPLLWLLEATGALKHRV
jgi:Double-GTPase 2